MTTEGINRKLIAVLNADVKDYSRLMSQDQVGTIKTLNTHRKAFANLVQKYRGRVIDNPVDEILAERKSPSIYAFCNLCLGGAAAANSVKCYNR